MKYFVERTFIKDLRTLPKEVKEVVKEYFNSVEKATAFNELSDNLTILTDTKFTILIG